MDRRARVLVVDDDATIRRLLCAALEGAGYEATCAGDGEEALRLLRGPPERRLRPDAIVLDLSMPGVSGMAFARRYRRMRLIRAPIIVLSGDADAAERAEEMGAVAMIGKPFDVDALLMAVGRAVARETRAA